MTGIDRLAADMAAGGTRFVFAITGSGASLELCDRLEKAGVSIIRTHFEGSAALMAATVARVTGSPSAAITIKGPGVANLLPGLAASFYEALPMIAISEAYPPGSPPSKAHKRLDHETIVGPVTKAVINVSDEVPVFDQAWELATGEVPGPVMLQLAGPENARAQLPEAPSMPVPDHSVVDRIASAQRPLVIAGSLAIRENWSDALAQLSVPVFSTAAAKGVLDEGLAHAANVYTGVGLEHTPEARLLDQADLVVGLGLRPNEVLATKPFPCTSVNVEATTDIAGADAFAFSGTASSFQAGDVFAALSDKSWGLDDLAACLATLDTRMQDSFLSGRVFAILQEHFARQARLVLDTGYFCTIGEHAIRAARSDFCLMSGQGRYMGTGVPMALAAALADPSVPTIAVCGDGGIGMYVGELRLAVERKLPLLVVLMTDGRFGSVATRAIQQNLTQTPISLSNPSWLSIMEGFGLPATEAKDEAGLRTALEAWNPLDGPAYLEIPFPPDQYERMIEGIR